MATDWSALELEYVRGSMSYKELGDKHGIKEATVRQRSNRHDWSQKRHELSQKLEAAAQAEHIDKRVDELVKFNEDDLKVARAIRAKIARKISASDELSANDLRALAGAHEAAQRVGRLAMGATTENTGMSAPNGGPVQHEEVGAGFNALAELMRAGQKEAQ